MHVAPIIVGILYFIIGAISAFIALCDPEGRGAKWCIPLFFAWPYFLRKLNK